jgi:hypothetical protein
MKSPDFKSVLMAGVIGAVGLYAINTLRNDTYDNAQSDFVFGFILGAFVQVLIRLTGVS